MIRRVLAVAAATGLAVIVSGVGAPTATGQPVSAVSAAGSGGTGIGTVILVLVVLLILVAVGGVAIATGIQRSRQREGSRVGGDRMLGRAFRSPPGNPGEQAPSGNL